MQNKDLPFTEYKIDNCPDLPSAIWWVDNFGNCKTTILSSEAKIEGLTYYSRLKDVPNGETALITGSSGLGSWRFLELVVQGESASKKLGLTSGAGINPACSR